MRYRLIDTPTGPIVLCEDDAGAISTGWLRANESPDGVEDASLRPDIVNLIQRYFDGHAVDFSSVPTPAGPSFHQRCWSACRTIKRGETWSYAQLAEAAGGERNAARAAGQAMRCNPLPIIIPCHRVRAASGGIGGFSGSDDPRSRSLATKRWLLAMESGAFALSSEPAAGNREWAIGADGCRLPAPDSRNAAMRMRISIS